MRKRHTTHRCVRTESLNDFSNNYYQLIIQPPHYVSGSPQLKFILKLFYHLKASEDLSGKLKEKL